MRPGRSAIFSVSRLPSRARFGGDRFQSFELGGRHRGLGFAHAIVGGERVEPAPLTPVPSLVAVFLQQRTEPFVVETDDAAVAAGDVLGVLEREAGEVAHRADRPAAGSAPPTIGAVFDQDQLVPIRQSLECIQIARVACQVDRDDRLGLGRDPPFDVRHVEIVGAGPQVGENGHGLLVQDADDGPDVGDRRGDHLIAQPDAGRRDGNVQRRRPGGAGLHMLQGTDLLKALREQFRLGTLPIEERVLLEHRLELLPFRLAPANPRGRRLLDGLLAAVHGQLGCRAGSGLLLRPHHCARQQ